MAYLHCRENDSCVGMGEARCHTFADTLSLLVILGLCIHQTDRETDRERWTKAGILLNTKNMCYTESN